MTHVTLKQVAAEAGVSTQTASHILNTGHGEPYRPETRQNVRAVAARLGYRPNAAARSMLRRNTLVVGAVVPIGEHSWFSQVDVLEILFGLNLRLAQAGYVTSVIPIGALTEPDLESRAFREQMLDAVVAISLEEESLCRRVAAIAPVCVWCDTNMAQPTGCLQRDERQAGEVVAQHLTALGYRRLVWVTYAPARPHYSHAARLAGIQAVAAAHDVPVEILRCTQPYIGAEAATLVDWMQPDTAIIAEHHHFAQAVVNLGSRHRRLAGQEFGLAACDISQERARLWPDLAGVRVNRLAIGSRAAEMVLTAVTAGERASASHLFPAAWQPGATAPGPR